MRVIALSHALSAHLATVCSEQSLQCCIPGSCRRRLLMSSIPQNTRLQQLAGAIAKKRGRPRKHMTAAALKKRQDKYNEPRAQARRMRVIALSAHLATVCIEQYYSSTWQ